MKKAALILVLAMALMASLTITTMAEPGLEAGLGYDSLNSTSTISLNNIELLEHSSPCKMYTLFFGYEVNDWLSFSGKYSTGDNNLLGLLGADLITKDTQIWQVEAAFQWSISEKTKLGAVLGYLDYESTTSLLGFGATNAISGGYIGPVLTLTPSDTWEFGASYRYMFGADSDFSILNYSIPADDASYAVAEIYGKAKVSENWTLKVAYTYASLDSEIATDIYIPILGNLTFKGEREISGLSVMLGYKF